MVNVMYVSVNLYSDINGELNNFLSKFYNTNLDISDKLSWEKEYNNPIELAEIVGVYIDNINKFSINMWICLDKNVYVQVNENNGDLIIKYLYERFPY